MAEEKQVLFNIYELENLTPIAISELPSDFPFFTITGESPYSGDFFLTPHTTKTHTNNYIFSMNNKGEVTNYKKITNQAYDFKKVKNSKGKTRYTYLDVISKEEPTVGDAGFYENTELVVLDEKMNEIDRKRFAKAGEVPKDYPAENHFSLYIDDGHYIIANYFRPEGSDKYENAIQELKWGKVVWHWETNDSPELAPLSHTTPTGDYAHINAMNFDYDGNFIISFRNIGIVKLNKETKEVMWVIGKNRNDFTDLDTSFIPFQQHDIRVLKNDGSITMFDNYGDPEQKSRVLRFWLDDVNMICEKSEEYVTTKTRSGYMGSAQLIDGSKNVYDISYGSGWNFGFEEYDFSTNTQLMQLIFNDGYDLYNVIRDVDDLASSFNGGNTEVNPPVVLPIPTYSVENEVFDGTKHIDTGIKLFDKPKDFSFVVKYTFDRDYLNTSPSGDYQVIVHNMHEVSPWDGLTVNFVKGTTTSSQSLDVILTTPVSRFLVIPTGTQNSSLPLTSIIVFTRESSGVMTSMAYNNDGSIRVAKTTMNNVYKSTGEYINQNLILGSADMIDKMDRFFVGEIEYFGLYDKVLSNDEIPNIVKSLI